MPLDEGTQGTQVRLGAPGRQHRSIVPMPVPHHWPGWEASCQGNLRLSRVKDKWGAPGGAYTHTQAFMAADPRGFLCLRRSPWLFPDVRSPGSREPASPQPCSLTPA